MANHTERRIVRAFNKYYGGTGSLGAFADELMDLAREIGRRHSTNKKAVANEAEQTRDDEALSDFLYGEE